MKIDEDYFLYKYKPIEGLEEKESYFINNFDEMPAFIEFAHKIKQLWTVIIDDDNVMCIVPGKRFVNRIAYVVTEEVYNEWEERDLSVFFF